MTLLEQVYDMVYNLFDGYEELPSTMQQQAMVFVTLITWGIFLGLFLFMFKLIQWIFRAVL